jgi:signal transduction histidine kinase
MDSLRVGARSFLVIGGVALDSAALAGLSPDPELSVRLTLPGAPDDWSRSDAIGVFPLPFVDGLAEPDRAGTARVLVLRTGNALPGLLASMDRWFALAGVATVLLALLLAAVLSARVSRPLTDLAERTDALDLDRLDQTFPVERADEIGRLAGVLSSLTGRLRASAARLREAERRATVGDVARQVNHDVKNGLAPIRHVLRHLGQVARDQPEQLAEVYREREGTLESSVAYLEQLARNYARLTPRVDRELCDLNAVAREATAGAGDSGGRLDLMLADNLPPVRADAVVLRRILENLLGNAFDALDGDGRVLVATESGDERTPGVKLIIADTGRGMTSEELERAFDDFYTTKPNGTGLGLSVVRRLVADVGGVLRVRTEPGAGTRFEIEFPAERGTA